MMWSGSTAVRREPPPSVSPTVTQTSLTIAERLDPSTRIVDTTQGREEDGTAAFGRLTGVVGSARPPAAPTDTNGSRVTTIPFAPIRATVDVSGKGVRKADSDRMSAAGSACASICKAPLMYRVAKTAKATANNAAAMNMGR